MNDSDQQQSHQIGMLAFARDLPNICSLAGLLFAVLSIYYAILGNLSIAIIGMLWAVVFDWGDGLIARRMKGRTDEYRAFGGQLDSLIDIVSFGICPAVFLLSYGNFSPWFLPGAFVIVAVGVIRLSYFNVFGLVDNSTYMGLALDNNVLILAFIFLFNSYFSQPVFTIAVYALLMIIAAFNVAPIRTPKFSSKWFSVLLIYVMGLTAIYI
ncbi:CDP-alcohol phosphatidyltransferase family protein [Methanolobus sp.]|jgi:CDP-diacylglycerol--serine O-phosphatidyltransferase|uniref:CDP-alcohol phosphatidyltransferase family protein n=1 Tax=Methanolobus sp. TaxID=1874737 RepID=UPI0025EAF44A|nr:CDP-alcohol phosphatidyltransferase family protein [Methanolobus sp.]